VSGFEAIPKVTEGNLLEAVEKIKRNLEILTGTALRGDPLYKAVLNQDMVNSGLGGLNRSGLLTAPPGISGGVDIIDSGSVQSSAQYNTPRFSTDYRTYLLLCDHLVPATNNVTLFTRMFSVASTSALSGASDYAHARDAISQGAASTLTGDDQDSEIEIVSGVGNTGDGSASIQLWVYNPMSGNSRTSMNWSLSYTDQGGTFRAVHGGGQRQNIEVNNGVKLLFSSGNIATMNYTLYGFRVK
jgi:hypothetical protein